MWKTGAAPGWESGRYAMRARKRVTVVTGIDYVARALTLRQTSERAAMKRARKADRGEQRG